MKVLSLLFSFYISSLSLVPCGDLEDIHISGEKHASVNTTGCDHEHDAESCTPFCICACCGTHTPVPSVTVLSINNVEEEFFFVPFQLNFVPDVFFPIWQPPKIG